MSRFNRSGHWRTSASGNTHWVSEHVVDRDTWHSGLAAPVPEALPSWARRPWYWKGDWHKPASLDECFYEPNATCPQCGARVYFYQNEFGSKVYFDHLGPPWPKHPCMDTGEHGVHETRAGTPRIEPARRQQREVVALLAYYWHAGATRDLAQGHASMQAASDRCLIGRLSQIDNARTTFLLEITHGSLQRTMRCASTPLPASLKNGSTVFVIGTEFCFFDIGRLAPVFIRFQKV